MALLVDNVNYAVSVVVKWVFDSHYKKALPLIIDMFHLIFTCSDEDDYFAKFQVVYYAVSCANTKEISKHVQK